MNVESHWLCRGYVLSLALVPRDRWRNVNLSVLWVALTVVTTGHAMAQATESDQVIAPECKCRSPDGQMQDLGTVQCVDIVGRKNLMRCEMSTNTPYWKKIEGASGCPDA